ncbi:MAG: hypothetical protein WCR44_00470 [Verrucomicrobiota bacterium]
MKTATKSTIRSTDELWQWAALKRSASLAPKRSMTSSMARHSSSMAQGILNRLYEILGVTSKSRR